MVKYDSQGNITYYDLVSFYNISEYFFVTVIVIEKIILYYIFLKFCCDMWS